MFAESIGHFFSTYKPIPMTSTVPYECRPRGYRDPEEERELTSVLF
jgi:hypothetical protein